jgi:hypothetical protein
MKKLYLFFVLVSFTDITQCAFAEGVVPHERLVTDVPDSRIDLPDTSSLETGGRLEVEEPTLPGNVEYLEDIGPGKTSRSDSGIFDDYEGGLLDDISFDSIEPSEEIVEAERPITPTLGVGEKSPIYVKPEPVRVTESSATLSEGRRTEPFVSRSELNLEGVEEKISEIETDIKKLSKQSLASYADYSTQFDQLEEVLKSLDSFLDKVKNQKNNAKLDPELQQIANSNLELLSPVYEKVRQLRDVVLDRMKTRSIDTKSFMIEAQRVSEQIDKAQGENLFGRDSSLSKAAKKLQELEAALDAALEGAPEGDQDYKSTLNSIKKLVDMHADTLKRKQLVELRKQGLVDQISFASRKMEVALNSGDSGYFFTSEGKTLLKESKKILNSVDKIISDDPLVKDKVLEQHTMNAYRYHIKELINRGIIQSAQEAMVPGFFERPDVTAVNEELRDRSYDEHLSLWKDSLDFAWVHAFRDRLAGFIDHAETFTSVIRSDFGGSIAVRAMRRSSLASGKASRRVSEVDSGETSSRRGSEVGSPAYSRKNSKVIVPDSGLESFTEAKEDSESLFTDDSLDDIAVRRSSGSDR